jgi:hypothetical protein
MMNTGPFRGLLAARLCCIPALSHFGLRAASAQTVKVGPAPSDLESALQAQRELMASRGGVFGHCGPMSFTGPLAAAARHRTALGVIVGCIGLLASLSAAPQTLLQPTPGPSTVWPKVLVVSADWLAKSPPAKRLNAPELPETLYPGQRLFLAISAQGPDHDRLLDGVTLSVRIPTPAGRVFEVKGLKAVDRRQVKPEGEDVTLAVLRAGGISQIDQATLEKAMTSVAFAVYDPGWTAPATDQEIDVQVSVVIDGKQPAATFETVHLRVRPSADWLKGPPVGIDELGKYLNRYHEEVPPGRLLALLKAISDSGHLSTPSVLSYFAVAFSERREAREAAAALFPSLDPKTQMAVAVALRFGGQDIAPFKARLPAAAAASLDHLEPMKDPRTAMVYKDPISMEVVRGLGSTMDECWGGWMATGDPTYLRALVNLLGGAPDYPNLRHWIETRGGEKGLNASVARGLAYQTAGWSIGAFQRADPHVADWLAFWMKDPAFPEDIREQLEKLPANPDFQRK